MITKVKKSIKRIVCTRAAHYIANPVQGEADVFVPAAYEQRETLEDRWIITDSQTGEEHEFATPEAAQDFLPWMK